MSQSQKVETFYDFLADKYDAATTGKFQWTPPALVAEWLTPHLNARSRVLDLGVGTGQSCAFLAQIGCTVTALDISEKMLEITAQKFPQFELRQNDLNQGLAAPLLTRKFDAVLSVGVFEFLTDLDLVLGQVARVLESGGHFCFTFEEVVPGHELQKDEAGLSGSGSIVPGVSLEFVHHRYTREDIGARLAAAGLTPVRDARTQAYYKTAKMIPIMYGVVLARKS